MKLLLIKTSSLGDVFHTFPALTEAQQYFPDLEVTWVVEEGFAAMAGWHPAVKQVIPVAWRRWRKSLLAKDTRAEMKAFRAAMHAVQPDLILDAQGLIKSGVMTAFAKGPRKAGLDRQSARENLACFAYNETYAVPFGSHAIWRVRQLFAQALCYPLGAEDAFSYGLDKSRWQRPAVDGDYLVFLHGTTWITKLWPEVHWQALVRTAAAAGYKVLLPWGNEEEYARALRIASVDGAAEVLPKMGLSALNAYLCFAAGVVGVDTGLSHVVAGLEVPSVAIYGATDASLTGVLGAKVDVLKANFACSPCLNKQCKFNNQHPPCYDTVSAQNVWAALQAKMKA
jgi:heptosyltransferase I